MLKYSEIEDSIECIIITLKQNNKEPSINY